jgi:hypothetical protein
MRLSGKLHALAALYPTKEFRYLVDRRRELVWTLQYGDHSSRFSGTVPEAKLTSQTNSFLDFFIFAILFRRLITFFTTETFPNLVSDFHDEKMTRCPSLQRVYHFNCYFNSVPVSEWLDGGAWTGSIWLRIGTGGELL